MPITIVNKAIQKKIQFKKQKKSASEAALNANNQTINLKNKNNQLLKIINLSYLQFVKAESKKSKNKNQLVS